MFLHPMGPGADEAGRGRVPTEQSPQRSRLAWAAAAGVLVSIGYYLGARVGLALTLEPQPVSTLWPPNAILLSALLLAPRRWWWALLLAALPAHLAVELGAGIPWPMVLGWFVSNCTEAVIGAAGVRWLVSGPLWLDSARQVAVFLLFPALLAPFLSSFLDAAFVGLNRFGEAGYWEVWRTRFFSNVVAALTVVPVIVIVGGRGRELLIGASPRRVLEGTLLALTLVAVCLLVFASRPAGPQTNPALLYAPLPFLLWAAARFGPAGVSAGLLVFALIAIGGATQGLGPFITSSPQLNALSMQEFLVITAVPLLTLAAVMQERTRAERSARRSKDRLRLALRAARLGTWEWDIGRRRGSWSPDTRQLFGLPPEDTEVSVRSIFDRVLPEDRPRLAEALRRPPSPGGLYDVEFRIVLPDGAIRWVRANAIALSDSGPPTRLLGVTADITERKQVLEAVRESEARFRSVFEIGTLPMAFWHIDGRITDANDAFMRLVCCTRREIEVGDVYWSHLTAPEFRHRDLAALSELKAVGHCTSYEKEYLLRDGRRVPVLSAAARLGPDHGICVEMDLTGLRRVQGELEERLRFERLVGDLLTTFATKRLERAEEGLPPWLGRLGEFLGAERVTLLLTSPQNGTLRTTYDWAVAEPAPRLLALDSEEFPYLSQLMKRGEPVSADTLANLPPEAEADRNSLRRLGIGAVLATPIFLGGELFGGLLLTHAAPHSWPGDAIPRLRWVGEIFAYILARKAAESEVRSIEVLNSAVLASLPGATAILNQSGTILQVSGRSMVGPGDGLAPIDPPYLGRNYLHCCQELCERGDVAAAEVHRAVTSVLGGERSSSVASYAGYGPGGKLRWYEIWVARLARREGGAVLTTFDVTARKEAELEAARNRNDLAHMVRVVTMGELAASFAHELKQPLTAIMANAQAGRRLLTGRSPDPVELSDILSDIARDDRRAADVLARTTTLLRKDRLELEPLNLNELVRDVLGLVHSDILLHQVRARLELGAFVPMVRGDRVQLQQVVLNLILNAVDAVGRNGTGEREVTLRTADDKAGGIRVEVSDNGPGIPPDKLDRVFEAFYTTKASGLGMGLSIARTILDAHGGRVWATNDSPRGATVAFTLPQVEPGMVAGAVAPVGARS